MLARFKRIIPKKIRKSISNQVSIIKSETISANFLIFDDIYPHPYSDWRHNEYIYYLQNIEGTKIVTGVNNKNIFKDRGNHFEEFKVRYPEYKNNVLLFNEFDKYKTKLGYCLFYNNLKNIFPVISKNNIPFVFTLYPGGGFRLYDYDTEKNLTTYFNSPLFKHVIVNMPHVYEYLLNRLNVDSRKVSLIYGAPLILPEIVDDCTKDDSKIRIVFSSHNYMQHGIDKGYDIFNQVAKYFENNPLFDFTCIGGFTEKDNIVTTNNINFIPNILPEQLGIEFSKYDIIISPNRSHVLHYGAFDGFPTGSVVHACNSGCLMMLTDDWNNASKLGLHDNESYIFIAANSEFVIKKLIEISEKNVIKYIAKKGKETLLKQLDLSNQMTRRMTILNEYLK
jgi:hypothetical protein